MRAVEQMNNKIAFGGQIKVEVAKIGLLDLPAELILLINNKLSFKASVDLEQNYGGGRGTDPLSLKAVDSMWVRDRWI